MKKLLPLLILILISSACANKPTPDNTPTLSPTVKLEPTSVVKPQNTPTTNIASKTNRENFVNQQKPEMRKFNIAISYSGAESEVMNLSTEGSLSVALQSLKPGLESFRELGFKTMELTARDGKQTINLEVLDK